MSGGFYVRWKSGEPREGRVFDPLDSDHPAYAEPCPVCDQQLGDGRPVQLYVIGPDDEETQQRHEQGRWYSALAALLHADCMKAIPAAEQEGDNRG